MFPRFRSVLGRILILGLLAAGLPVLVAKAANPANNTPSTATHASANGNGQQTNEHIAIASPEDVWVGLMAGNQRFVAGKPKDREFVQTRKELAKGQHPRAIVLTCADSRVIPELIFDRSLGDLFVVRTAGNIADPVVLGSIEYAVDHLHANVLVVLGHDKCGAVAAAASGEPMPTPNLDAIVKKIRPALEGIKTRAPFDELVRQGVEANVHGVVKDLLKNSEFLRKEVARNKLGVFKAIYRLETGEVARLK